MSPTQFSCSCKLLSYSNWQRSNCCDKNCFIVKPQPGVFKCGNRHTAEVDVKALFVSNIANDKASKAIGFKQRARFSDDNPISSEKLCLCQGRKVCWIVAVTLKP